MTTWNHNGVEITLSPSGYFFASPPGHGNISGPSIDSVKKKLDGLRATGFEPFDAIETDYNRKEIVSFKVTGLIKSTSSYNRGSYVFKVDKKPGRESEPTRLIRDTPENRALLQAAIDAHQAWKAEDERLKDIASAAWKALPFERADGRKETD